MPPHITQFFQKQFEDHFKAFLKHEMRMPLEDNNNDVTIFCRDAVLSLIERIVDAISSIYEQLPNRTAVKAYPDMFLAIHMVLSRDLATHLTSRIANTLSECNLINIKRYNYEEIEVSFSVDMIEEIVKNRTSLKTSMDLYVALDACISYMLEEIFSQLKQNGKQPITLSNVKETIMRDESLRAAFFEDVLGKPKDFKIKSKAYANKSAQGITKATYEVMLQRYLNQGIKVSKEAYASITGHLMTYMDMLMRAVLDIRRNSITLKDCLESLHRHNLALAMAFNYITEYHNNKTAKEILDGFEPKTPCEIVVGCINEIVLQYAPKKKLDDDSMRLMHAVFEAYIANILVESSMLVTLQKKKTIKIEHTNYVATML
ncbi:hypothetical protein GUITHDRAFT_133417 [Guillardia theta CCMP2712]|uniref:Uncharacterized protein n=1 Tax=Guillardia theta (strain CCMP2712) TaxID=905079 RepID=L1JY53_GUITC|nr:hypothetical protein GUITHDRAFT_133417 [Guillardia theta CCMP2712]EKX53033.1 hypothetical protein GUITHDRAFT_133417 [Guillardia theta CCMP2712]|eukprot:XP_005840013.1 hypothetical protein GUITHDRAFT_133417 [Guillardia theta CCMP2712]